MIAIIVTIFVLFALSRNYLQFRDNHISGFQFIFWVLIWSLVLVILLWPNLTNRLAQYLGISRGIDVFVYLGIIVLFYLIFRSYVKIEELERDITRLVSELALKDMELGSRPSGHGTEIREK